MGRRSPLLAVLGLVAVAGVAVVVVGGIGGAILLYVGVQSLQGSAQADTTRLMMTRVAQRIEIHALRSGLPKSGGLAVVFPDGLPVDSWGNELTYVTPGPPGSTFELISYGADGQAGGTGTNADIKYSEL